MTAIDPNMQTVSARIGQIVQAFVQAKLANPVNSEFTAGELRLTVLSQITKIAPGSPDRILRSLRQQKKLNYVLLSRVKSLYKAIPVVTTVPEVLVGG